MEKIQNKKINEISDKEYLNCFYDVLENIKSVLGDENENFNRKYKYFKDNKRYFKIRTFHLRQLGKQYKKELKGYLELCEGKLAMNYIELIGKLVQIRVDLKKEELKIHSIF